VAAAGCGRTAFPHRAAASTRQMLTFPDRLVGCYTLAPSTIFRLNPRPHELLSEMLGRPAWSVDKLDSAGNVESLPAEWHDPMIYWSVDGTRLTIVYGSGFQGDVFRFDLAGARGDTLPGETAQTDDVGPHESPATRVTAVRRSCPGVIPDHLLQRTRRGGRTPAE